MSQRFRDRCTRKPRTLSSCWNGPCSTGEQGESPTQGGWGPGVRLGQDRGEGDLRRSEGSGVVDRRRPRKFDVPLTSCKIFTYKQSDFVVTLT